LPDARDLRHGISENCVLDYCDCAHPETTREIAPDTTR
jgi:hypothetical protein